MALAGTVQWDVRTTGDNTNGGGFDPGVTTPGTDYSVQDAAQVTYTDLVIDAATSTNLTSAATPFTSAHVGNIINITGGGGFSTGRYTVLSVAGAVATMDRSVGGTSSSGGAGKLGGGLASISAANSASVSFNTIHVKTGTYTFDSLTMPTSGNTLTMRGYGTAHNDGGTKPTITTAGSNVIIFTPGAGASFSCDNIYFQGGAGSNTYAFRSDNGVSALFLINCKTTGFATQIHDAGGGFQPLCADGCEFGGSGSGQILNHLGLLASHCYFHEASGSSSIGSGLATSTGPFIIDDCVFYLTQVPLLLNHDAVTNPVRVSNCIFHSCLGYGIRFNSFPYLGNQFVAIENNVFWNTTGWGISLTDVGTLSSTGGIVNRNNAFGSNSSGNRENWPVGANDITLTVDPCTNAAGGDFSLNATSGGGAALRAAGFPGVFGAGLATTGYADVGPVQHQDAGGGGTPTYVIAQTINRYGEEV